MQFITEVKTDKAPSPIGPYSQAVLAGQFLFISGHVGKDPETGLFAGNTIEEQTAPLNLYKSIRKMFYTLS